MTWRHLSTVVVSLVLGCSEQGLQSTDDPPDVPVPVTLDYLRDSDGDCGSWGFISTTGAWWQWGYADLMLQYQAAGTSTYEGIATYAVEMRQVPSASSYTRHHIVCRGGDVFRVATLLVFPGDCSGTWPGGGTAQMTSAEKLWSESGFASGRGWDLYLNERTETVVYQGCDGTDIVAYEETLLSQTGHYSIGGLESIVSDYGEPFDAYPVSLDIDLAGDSGLPANRSWYASDLPYVMGDGIGVLAFYPMGQDLREYDVSGTTLAP